MNTENKVIEASIEDIPVLVQHYRRMFEEIWQSWNWKLNNQKLNEMDEAYRAKLHSEMKNESCKAWVIRKNGNIVASGAISTASMVPLPDDSSYKVGYLHSIFTENKYRKQGFAEMLVNKALEYCKSKNITRVSLNTSEAGRSIYEKIGFRLSDNTMRINLK